MVGPDVEAKFSCTCHKHVISTGGWLVFYPKNDDGFWRKLSMCLMCGPDHHTCRFFLSEASFLHVAYTGGLAKHLSYIACVGEKFITH